MITIVDYGMSNIGSIVRACTLAGEKNVVVSNKPSDITNATKIILPGQGGFPRGMENIRKLNLLTALKEAVIIQKKPLLGICLGMQILADVGYEYGKHKGLGFIAGSVKKLDISTQRYKLPHVGWDDIHINSQCPLFQNVPNHTDFYFVHSYIFAPKYASVVVATCNYSETFPAAIWQGNIFGTLFHPEKSQKYGLTILRNFLSL